MDEPLSWDFAEMDESGAHVRTQRAAQTPLMAGAQGAPGVGRPPPQTHVAAGLAHKKGPRETNSRGPSGNVPMKRKTSGEVPPTKSGF